MKFKFKFTLFVVAACLLEILSAKAIAETISTDCSSNADLVAIGAFVFMCIFGLVELFRYHTSKIEQLNDSLADERQRKEALRYALNDIVDNFGDNGMNMHRSTLEKLNALSRARSALGRIKG